AAGALRPPGGDADTTEGQVVLLSQQLGHRQGQLDAAPLVGGAGVDQGVAGGAGFGPQGVDPGLGVGPVQFEVVGPGPQGLLHGDAQVEGLDVVEIAATGALAPGVAGKALELAATPAGVVPQLAVHEQLQAVKARVPVGELQLGAGEGRHVAGVEGANRVDVDVVGHVGGVGAQGELPGARAGSFPGQAGA